MEEHGDIYGLPEGCISKILSLTSPRDACTSSAISSAFKSASDSDAVWEKFLPDDYRDIAAGAVPPFESKKELYLRLCDEHLLIDGGNKSFKLEKASGKKCFMVGARELDIMWGDTPEYWTWTSDEQSRFAEVAQLLDVFWLHIEGKINTRTLSPRTTYVVYLVVKFAERTSWFYRPTAEVTVKFAGGGTATGTRSVNLDLNFNQRPQVQFAIRRSIVPGGGTASGTRSVNLDSEFNQRLHMQLPVRHLVLEPCLGARRPVSSASPTRSGNQVLREREDGWMEVEMGEFYNEDGEDGDVEVSFAETKGGNWKRGLVVQGIELRPRKDE